MVGLLKGINTVAKKLGISVDKGKGYRALANISEHGGQEVPHLHFHLFGGEKNRKNGRVIEKIDRYYLEILSSDYLKAKSKPTEDLVIELIDPISFELNKFFYKQVGKKYQWIDRLVWENKDWINYTSNNNQVENLCVKKK